MKRLAIITDVHALRDVLAQIERAYLPRFAATTTKYRKPLQPQRVGDAFCHWNRAGYGRPYRDLEVA